MTPSGRAIVPASWALYDFANTIFSFAVVSGAIGLYLVNDRQFGERDGNVLLSLAIVVSVGLNAIVSPILGALSDRAGRRLPNECAPTAGWARFATCHSRLAARAPARAWWSGQ